MLLRAVMAAAGLALLLSPQLASAKAPRKKAKPQAPNLVVLLTDDQTLASYTPSVMPITTTLLGKRGTTFTQGIVSTPQCCPSRAGLFTGQYAHNNGVRSNNPGYASLKRPRSTLPAWLSKAGYRTAHIGKFLNGYPRPIHSAPGWTRWRTAIEPDYVAPKFSFDGKFMPLEEYLTYVNTREAVTAIRDFSPGRKPFYVQIDHTAPHIGSRNEPGRCAGGPIPPPEDEALYADAKVPPSPAIDERDVSDKPAFIRNRPLSTPEERARINLLYGCALGTLPAVDRGVREVVSALRETGELGNTMIVFLSDNGYSYGEHRVSLTKGLGYEEHIRVPFVVRPPKSFPRKFRRGARLKAPVANVDIAPTILHLAGAKPCAKGSCRRLDGRSLVPLLKGRKPKWSKRRGILTSFDINARVYKRSCSWVGLRTRKVSVIEHRSLPVPGTKRCRPTSSYERYDLKRDPHQLQNLGRKPKLAKRLNRLARCSGIKGRDAKRRGVPFCE